MIDRNSHRALVAGPFFIRMTRSEGTIGNAGRVIEARSFAEIDHKMLGGTWAPAVEGTHSEKCDFIIDLPPSEDYPQGTRYAGTYRLRNPSQGSPDLQAHVRSMLLMALDPARREQLLKHAPAQIEMASRMLRNYDFGQSHIPDLFVASRITIDEIDGITVTYSEGDETEKTLDLAFTWEICSPCEGNGTSSAYLGAYTADDWDQMDDSFKDDFKSGALARECDCCGGSGKVRKIREDMIPQRMREPIAAYRRSMDELAADEASESAMYGLRTI